MKLTPMLEQYLRAKEEVGDALLMFRLGDFYELFFEDAETAARVLEITLTTRSKKDEVPIPMCGVPHHAVQGYVARLLGAGFKVALCDQLEDASLAKGLVSRAVVRVVTPGTVTEEEYLDPKQPNYLAAVARDGAAVALLAADLSTGETRQTVLADAAGLGEWLGRLAPRELLVESGDEPLAAMLRAACPTAMLTPLSAARFDAAAGTGWLAAHGAEAPPRVAAALGALLGYLAATHRASIDHLRVPERDRAQAVLHIDEASRRNLELLATTRGERRGSLLSVLDETQTPMGGRLLRQWLLAPLTDIAAIGARLDAVETFVREPSRREGVTERLAGIGDLERLTARLAAARVTPRDLLGLAAALERVADLRAACAGVTAAALADAAAALDPLPALQAQIAATISDDVPLKPRPGQLVRTGCHAEIDELRELALHGKRFFVEYEARERQRTGISSLKVRYNQVFGYYLEVTKPNLHLVPEDYRRKQTIATGERFVTPALAEYEAKVLGAEERLGALEAQLFAELVRDAGAHHAALSRTAAALARLDVFAALALVAERRRYARPSVGRHRRIAISDGRHPVVEAVAGREGFVANDCRLDPDERQILIITGPNMAGKSTYLRQVALITLLAQMGSFVPAAAAEIGVVDRLFTRVGASDNLAGGESTFMVEMKETANILTQLTPRSLAVLDEIGRGTSTFDGISIAWAVAEHLHEADERPLVLFATHYHELTDLARSKPRVLNASVAVREWKGDVVFLRRIVEGPASQSYGIQVAKLAGVPAPIIERAGQILHNLERNELTDNGQPRLALDAQPAANGQLGLFAAADDRLREELAAIDVDRLAPLEALNRLHELVTRARRG
ncbi:MAG TPA: DNA mismatch repair protein MutS [Candidatus Dormibacteraeota bacterium]|nr:DNA mismatch repair protein MutS [Candidatus Dormibacteraeota bacterium]